MSNPLAGPTIATPGTWSSPIGLADVVAGGASMTALSSDGPDLLWLESIPDQDGRITVMRLRPGQATGDEPTELTPAPASVRSRVNEYGGGAYSCAAGVLVYCDDSDATVKLRHDDGTVQALTSGDALLRYGDLRVHPDLGLVLAIREDHREPGEAQTTIVAIEFPATDGLPGREHVLCSGASFYASPELSPDGQFAFVEWNHPAMPWDSSLLKVGRLQLEDGPAPTDIQTIAGIEHAGLDGVAVQHPRWASDGSLVFTSDASGHHLLCAWSNGQTRRLHSDSADFDLPKWVLGNHAHAELDTDRILTWSLTEGQGQLAIVSTTGEPTKRLAGVSMVDSLCACQGQGYAIVDRPAHPRALVRVPDGGKLHVVRRLGAEPEHEYVSVARSLLFDGRHGPVQAWYYPPTNPEFKSPPAVRPPLLVRVHGGPTAIATNGYDPEGDAVVHREQLDQRVHRSSVPRVVSPQHPCPHRGAARSR